MTGATQTTSVPRQLMESFEKLDRWPEGEPTPHYPHPQPGKGILSHILYHIPTKLHLRRPYPPLSDTDQRVVEIADFVENRLANIYHTHFTTYTVVKYSEDNTGHGNGTLYTIEIRISPAIKGHNKLEIDVFRAENGTEYLSKHCLT